MATRYWVGGTGNWSDAANHWSNASGGTPNSAYLPVSGDDVLFDQASTNCTLDVTPPNLGTVYLRNGTLNLNGKTLTCTKFDSVVNSDARTLAFDTGNITLIGTDTRPWEVATFIGSNILTITGTPVVNLISSATAATTVSLYVSSTSQRVSFNVTSGVYTLKLLGNGQVANLNFTGFSGVWDFGASTYNDVGGNLTLSSTMTTSGTSSNLSMTPSSGTTTITTNGRVISTSFVASFQNSNTTVQLQDNLTAGSFFCLTYSGTTQNVDLNGKQVSVATCSLGSGVTVTFNGGTVICTGNFTGAWTAVVNNGIGTGKISMTSASPKTFDGGGVTYNCIVSNDGAGALTITGSNTFTTLQNTVQPATFTFTAGTIQTITNFNINGAAGNLVTINSTSSSAAYLSKAGGGVVSCDYLNITNSSVSPAGFTWYAGANSVNSGGNFGWVFSAPPASSSQQFFMLF